MATPQAETKIRLFDLVVTELTVTEQENCARLLVSLKQASTQDEAAERLRTLPYTIFRNLTRAEAAPLHEQLQRAGVPTIPQISLIACPYCSFSGEQEGSSSRKLGGVLFVCYACSQRFLVGADDHLPRILLECSQCGKSTRLPANAHSGEYPCACGAQLGYKERARPQARAAEEVRPQAPVTVLKWEGGPPPTSVPLRRERSRLESFNPALLVVIMLGAALLAAFLISYLSWPAPPTAREQGQVFVDTVLKRFTTRTTYAEVIATLGKPQVELEGESLGQRRLVYPHFDLSVTVQEQAGRYYYVAAYWLSDKSVAHLAVPVP